METITLAVLTVFFRSATVKTITKMFVMSLCQQFHLTTFAHNLSLSLDCFVANRFDFLSLSQFYFFEIVFTANIIVEKLELLSMPFAGLQLFNRSLMTFF